MQYKGATWSGLLTIFLALGFGLGGGKVIASFSGLEYIGGACFLIAFGISIYLFVSGLASSKAKAKEKTDEGKVTDNVVVRDIKKDSANTIYPIVGLAIVTIIGVVMIYKVLGKRDASKTRKTESTKDTE